MGMREFADHIIATAQKNDKEITNLQLQKIMYFSLKHMKEKKLLSYERLNEIYDEPFLVWAYGPVIKSQYERFKRFSSSPILGVFEYDETLSSLESIILEELNKKVSNLITKSHQIEFWKKNKDKIKGFRSNIAYSFGDI